MSTVLITRPKADAEAFATALAHYGLRAEFFPMIEIVPLSDWALPNLAGYDALIYTSANAVRCFLSELLARAPDLFAKLRALNHYAVGVKTNRALQEYGIDSALYSDKGNAEDLVELLRRFGIKGKRFLFLRGSRSLGIVPEAIKKYGGSCEELIVYETRDLSEEKARDLPTLLLRDDVTWIAFFSPSAVQGFFKSLPSELLPLRQRLAAIGNTTKEAVEHFGFSVQAVPDVPTAEALAHTIAKFTSP
ncbi:MAG: uroporphyrinogen-III synthase [Chloroherpetonaceae bacterium]